MIKLSRERKLYSFKRDVMCYVCLTHKKKPNSILIICSSDPGLLYICQNHATETENSLQLIKKIPSQSSLNPNSFF